MRVQGGRGGGRAELGSRGFVLGSVEQSVLGSIGRFAVPPRIGEAIWRVVCPCLAAGARAARVVMHVAVGEAGARAWAVARWWPPPVRIVVVRLPSTSPLAAVGVGDEGAVALVRGLDAHVGCSARVRECASALITPAPPPPPIAPRQPRTYFADARPTSWPAVCRSASMTPTGLRWPALYRSASETPYPPREKRCSR